MAMAGIAALLRRYERVCVRAVTIWGVAPVLISVFLSALCLELLLGSGFQGASWVKAECTWLLVTTVYLIMQPLAFALGETVDQQINPWAALRSALRPTSGFIIAVGALIPLAIFYAEACARQFIEDRPPYEDTIPGKYYEQLIVFLFHPSKDLNLLFYGIYNVALLSLFLAAAIVTGITAVRLAGRGWVARLFGDGANPAEADSHGAAARKLREQAAICRAQAAAEEKIASDAIAEGGLTVYDSRALRAQIQSLRYQLQRQARRDATILSHAEHLGRTSVDFSRDKNISENSSSPVIGLLSEVFGLVENAVAKARRAHEVAVHETDSTSVEIARLERVLDLSERAAKAREHALYLTDKLLQLEQSALQHDNELSRIAKLAQPIEKTLELDRAEDGFVFEGPLGVGRYVLQPRAVETIKPWMTMAVTFALQLMAVITLPKLGADVGIASEARGSLVTDALWLVPLEMLGIVGLMLASAWLTIRMFRQEPPVDYPNDSIWSAVISTVLSTIFCVLMMASLAQGAQIFFQALLLSKNIPCNSIYAVLLNAIIALFGNGKDAPIQIWVAIIAACFSVGPLAVALLSYSGKKNGFIESMESSWLRLGLVAVSGIAVGSLIYFATPMVANALYSKSVATIQGCTPPVPPSPPLSSPSPAEVTCQPKGVLSVNPNDSMSSSSGTYSRDAWRFAKSDELVIGSERCNVQIDETANYVVSVGLASQEGSYGPNVDLAQKRSLALLQAALNKAGNAEWAKHAFVLNLGRHRDAASGPVFDREGSHADQRSVLLLWGRKADKETIPETMRKVRDYVCQRDPHAIGPNGATVAEYKDGKLEEAMTLGECPIKQAGR